MVKIKSGKHSVRPLVFKAAVALCFIVFFVYSNLSAELTTHNAEVTFLEGKQLISPMLKDINKASKSIDVSIYLFKTDRHKPGDTEILLSAIKKAAERGVKVRVVFDIEDSSNSFGNKANLETGEKLKASGAIVVYDSPKKRLHTKMMIIDEKVVYLGSHNYTYSAFNHNDEVTLRLESDSLAAEASEYIERLLN
jgi:phosphatidylserine/phosphatidylglycerophosphate/cardiolipin synthase-like enzyme